MQYKQDLDKKTKDMFAALVRVGVILFGTSLLSITVFILLLLFIAAD